MRIRIPHLLRVIGVVLFLLCAAHGVLAQLNQDCTVSVLNRTVQVNPDGSWVLPNVPANFGQVKARATCVRNGVTISGESDYFTIPANGAVNLPAIILGAATPIPSALGIGPANPSFTSAGQMIQLVVTATFSDNSTEDVSAGSTGTNYTSSNPAIATVNANGLVTAISSGTVVLQASNDGATGITKATVLLSNVDTDNDGIPDDVEATLGLDPHNPVDAQEDFDRDDLTNLKEFQLGTGLRVFDTDGDGIGDGLEVESGSNPLDPNSFNLAQILKSIKVTPTTVALTVNTIIGVATQQLTVTGTLTDGNSINLTARSRGTNYSSSNLSVANFGATDGLVFAGSDGSATITVSNNGHTATVQVTVSSFSPAALSFISIPGFANNVDISGNIAYVAAGSTGLQVVDVSDRRAPRIIGSLDTPGNANDVRVVGNRAYVADGSAGLRIVDISNPASPVPLGSLDTAGEANDVVVVGNLAYIADGPAGLQIIDVSDPVVPRLIGTLDTPGIARGVDVSGNVAVIADGNSLRIVDVGSPSSPVARGSLTTTDARDVTVEGTIAYLADFSGSLKTIDFSTPTAPRLLATTTQALGGILTDVAKVREFVFGADVFFVNGVPIVNVNDPANPSVRARLDFPARDDNGTGIAVDNQFVYLTADHSIQENGINGDSRLYIGQYQSIEDKNGIPPTIQITSPAPNDQVIQGGSVTVTANATDDVAVAAVNFFIDGQLAFTSTTAPYQYTFTAPIVGSTLVLGATAVDFGNNVGQASNVTLNLIPDPLTTVVGRVVNSTGQSVAGSTVTVFSSFSATTGRDGLFTISGVPTVRGDIVARAVGTVGGRAAFGTSSSVPPVPGSLTSVGDIRLSILQGNIDLIPYLATGYKYLVVGHGQNSGFEQPGFDDSAFATGDAGFGSLGGCSLNTTVFVKTDWPLNTDMLLRKQFDIDAIPQSLTVAVAIDNDVQVFVNGHDVSGGIRQHDGCPSRDSFVFTVPTNILNVGTNLIAVRAVDRGGAAYADIQVTAVYPTVNQTLNMNIPPRGTFLRTDTGDTAAQTSFVLDLVSLGIQPGSSISLQELGDFAFCTSCPDNGHALIGVFSSTNTFLPPSILNRIPDAIATGQPAVVTPLTLFEGLPTDIPQDFGISAAGTQVVVPAGARFLFVAVSDSFWGDNNDPNNNYALRVTFIPSQLAIKRAPPSVSTESPARTSSEKKK